MNTFNNGRKKYSKLQIYYDFSHLTLIYNLALWAYFRHRRALLKLQRFVKRDVIKFQIRHLQFKIIIKMSESDYNYDCQLKN